MQVQAFGSEIPSHPAILVMRDPTGSDIATFCRDGLITIRNNTLRFSSQITPFVDDQFLNNFFKNAPFKDQFATITRFDFAAYPRLGPNSMQLLLTHCPNLKASFYQSWIEETASAEGLELYKSDPSEKEAVQEIALYRRGLEEMRSRGFTLQNEEIPVARRVLHLHTEPLSSEEVDQEALAFVQEGKRHKLSPKSSFDLAYICRGSFHPKRHLLLKELLERILPSPECPDSFTCKMWLAELLFTEGLRVAQDPTSAIELLEEIVQGKDEREQPWATICLAHLLMQSSRPEDALAVIGKLTLKGKFLAHALFLRKLTGETFTINDLPYLPDHVLNPYEIKDHLISKVIIGDFTLPAVSSKAFTDMQQVCRIEGFMQRLWKAEPFYSLHLKLAIDQFPAAEQAFIFEHFFDRKLFT